MSLKENIFDSKSEKNLFNHLNSIWKNHFNIYPQLPFTKIFDIDSLDVRSNERNFLLKTNIDITVCDKNDKPLMSIEFDGMSGGYNREAEYIQIKEDPLRKKKLELKLKIAIEHRYPFYIISFPEKNFLSEQINLSVIDSIIGQTIAGKNFYDKINEYLVNSRDALNTMNKFEKHEYIQDLVMSAEVELELTYDPIAKKAAEIDHILVSKGITSGYSINFSSTPELPEVKDVYDTEGLKNRLNAWSKIQWHGCEVSCDTPKGKVTERAWVRNFEGMLASPLTIVENIALLLAFYKAASINGIRV